MMVSIQTVEVTNLNKKKAIQLSAISFPLAYIIGAIVSRITYLGYDLTGGIIPGLKMDISFIALVIVFNVIALIKAFAKE